MKHFFKNLFCILFAFLISVGAAYSFNRLNPDCVIMKDGTCYKGLIVKSDAEEITLQQPLGELTIDKTYVQRIDDASKSMSYFADLVNVDKAPPWRMMVQDLRCNDAVKSFFQIPPIRIKDDSCLKNVPYLSFSVNKHGEMNVYGNPKDAACVELGSYLHGEHLKKFQDLARQFLAGYISSRPGIKTLYSLNLKGDEQRVGKFVFRIMSPNDPDAHGGWWISIYDPERLAKARISDSEYAKLTLPFYEVRGADGTVRHDLEAKHRSFLNTSMMRWLGKLPGFHGFYRNQENELQVVKNTSF